MTTVTATTATTTPRRYSGPLPPGPEGWPLVGSFPALRRDPLGFLTRTAREHGDVAGFRVLGVPAVLLSRPVDIETVLVTGSRSFVKGRGLQAGRPVFGNGLLTSEGDFWRRQRRLMQPAFHRERVASYADGMARAAERMVDGWSDGETRNVHRDLMALTLTIVCQALFSTDISRDTAAVGEALEVALRGFPALLNPLRRGLAQRFPTPLGVRVKRAVATLDDVIARFIAARRAREDEADEGDLLSMLLAARDDDGSGMTDRQLRDEVMTLFLAGHETTAIALTWCLALLARHPEADARIAAELDSVLAGRRPTAADLPRLTYTEWVVKEAMRLYPPAWVIGRTAVEDVEIAGWRLPRGAAAVVSPWVTHRDGRLFVRPLDFLPERWSWPETKSLPRFAYFPFGGGARQCIGNQFAMMEAVLVLAAVAQRFRLTLPPGATIEPWPSVTLRPKGEVRMRVERRDGP